MATRSEATTTEPTTEVPAEEDLKGVLVLASGARVRVPAEGVQVGTHHFDEDLGQLVPVVSTFVLD